MAISETSTAVKSSSRGSFIKTLLYGKNRINEEKANITIKGDLIKQAFITSSMGVSYKLKLPKVL